MTPGKNIFIVQGKPFHLDGLRDEIDNPSDEYDPAWTCPATVKENDLMLVYLLAPVSSIVAYGYFDSPAFINDDPESEWFDKRMATYRDLKLLQPENYISLGELRLLFADWFWTTRPQGAVMVPDKPGLKIKEPFLELLNGRIERNGGETLTF